jgi:hypothetical protein
VAPAARFVPGALAYRAPRFAEWVTAGVMSVLHQALLDVLGRYANRPAGRETAGQAAR